MTPSPTHLLLDWFDQNGRTLPWRVKNGPHFDPYAVWISEIMLQQTTVKTVVDYFIRWMQKFPDIVSLSRAPLDEVLLAWQGLGYYTRARKIHECAQKLVTQHGGALPDNRETLLKLPGIGPYTASSICAFAFNLPETVVDGNVIRVIARFYGLTHAVSRTEIYALAQKLTSQTRPADYASAIMDLGATVCTPASPDCEHCPWQQNCVARAKGIAAQIPVISKPAKKDRHGKIFLIQNKAGAYFIRKREEKGLLSGLYEFPWQLDDEPAAVDVSPTAEKPLVHVFTHFKLTLKICRLQMEQPPFAGGLFVAPEEFKNYPFSTLMAKAIRRLPRDASLLDNL